MPIEHYLIKSFVKDRATFDKLHPRIRGVTLDPILTKLVKMVQKYYHDFPQHSFVSEDQLVAYLDLLWPVLKDRELYVRLIHDIYQVDTSDSIAELKVQQLKLKDVANLIAQTCLPALQGEDLEIIPKLKEIIQEAETSLDLSLDDDEEEFLSNDITHILEKKTLNGLRWRIPSLNDCLGPLPGLGKIIHLASRPNAGKTTLLASEITFMAEQLAADDCILWIHNEEDGTSVQERWYQAILNATSEQIANNPERAQALFMQRGGGKLRMHDRDSITIEAIDALIQKHRPRLVVVDIADHVGFKGEGKVTNGAEKLKVLYRHFRNMGKKYHRQFPIDLILTGWSDATTENKKWFGQNQLDGGKTGKPGSTDVIICIGQDEDPDSTNRYLSVCRNKLTGRTLREAIQIDKDRARFT